MLTAVLSMNPSRLEQARPEDFFPVKTIYRFAFFRSINLPFSINSCCKKKEEKITQYWLTKLLCMISKDKSNKSITCNHKHDFIKFEKRANTQRFAG